MKRLTRLCVIQFTALVQACAFAAATSSLSENRILLFDDYASSNWAHDGPTPVGIVKIPLRAGTNHFHRVGWRLLSCRTGTARGIGFVVPQSAATNFAANLQNTLGAQIESPVFTNGIGTVYFEAINNIDSTQITVEYATNMVNALNPLDFYPMIPPSTNGLVCNWMTLDVLTLNAASANDFTRYVKLLNYRQPAKLRICRTGTVYTDGYVLDDALTVIDNIRVSPPPSDVLVYNTEALDQSGNVIIRTYVSNADTNMPAASRVVTCFYRWPNLVPPDNAWKNMSMTMADAGDGQGNGERFEAQLPYQPVGRFNECCIVCAFDGYRYRSPDYTGLGYANYLTEGRSSLTTPVQTNIFARSGFYILNVTRGCGSGLSYTNGQQVTVTADALTGKIFERWTGDTQYVESVTSPTTVVTMPAADISLAATYGDGFVLIVNGGTGGGTYTNRQQVTVMADALTGKIFERWTGDTQYVASVTSSNTVVTMPAADIVLTATYVGFYPVTYYVDASRSDDNGAGISWATAKKTIQAAINSTVAGDTVLVAKGVYNTGTTVTPGYALYNRVVITNAISVRSVNGPEKTIIEGSGMSFYSTASAIRCVFMSKGVLDGFTLRQGSTYGFAQGDLAYDQGGGGVNMYNAAPDAIVTNCIIRNCIAFYGGAVYYGSYANCTLSSNSASFIGGGAYYGTLVNSKLSENVASDYGGGCYGSTLSNCAVIGNSTSRRDGVARGGGANKGKLSHCSIISNSVQFTGGGTYDCILDNCVLTRNTASVGGGSCSSTLINCTLSGNTASTGGGCYSGSLTNCIVHGNFSPDGALNNFDGSKFAYSCTTPLPSGAGNISRDPRFVDEWNLLLRGDSPCIDSGTNGPVTASADLSGLPRIQQGTVDMGAYEGSALAVELPVFNPPAGTLFTNSVMVSITCGTEDAVIRYTLDGRDPVETDEVYVRPFNITNTTTIYARAFKDGMFSSGDHASYRPCIFFVDSARPDDGGDGTSWGKAKKTIQAAVDLSLAGDTVLVTNGIYNVGATVAPGNSSYALNNRLVVTKAITVCSVNGPGVTVVVGSSGGLGTSSAVRGVYLSNGVLDGFTILGGATLGGGQAFSQYNSCGGGVNMYNCAAGAVVRNCIITNCLAWLSGGGASYATLNDCTLTCNSSSKDGGGVSAAVLNRCKLIANAASTYGGGANGCNLNNCVLANNTATSYGGGSYYGTLINCTLSGNSASVGAGSYYGTLKNCIVWNNKKSDGTTNNCDSTTFYYSCTSPLQSGSGNIDAEPLFVGLRDLRLRKGSSCIDAGNNAYASLPADVAGNTRIQNSAVDMGAYEGGFKLPQSITFPALPAKTYGDAAFAPTATASSGLIVEYASETPTVAVVSNGMLHIVGVGTATVIASQPGSGVYEPATPITNIIVVLKAQLVVTAENTNRVYGSTNPSFTVSFTGFVNGDTPECLLELPIATTSATSSSGTGNYEITVTGATANNYELTYLSGTLRINQKALTIKAKDLFILYGETVGPALSNITAEALEPGDSITSVTLRYGGDIPGTYTATPSNAQGLDLYDNYLVSYQEGTLTIGVPNVSIFPSKPLLRFTNNIEVSVTCILKSTYATIRYTCDGSDPTEVSDIYTSSILLSQTANFRTRAFVKGCAPGPISAANFIRLYRLSVTNGTVDGLTDAYYDAETNLLLVADTTPIGKTFDRWTGATQYLANVKSSSTTMTMPSQDITLAAVFKVNTYTVNFDTLSEEVYENAGTITLTVNGGNPTGMSSVRVYIQQGTATASDYTVPPAAQLTLTWAADEVGPKTVTIPIKQDTLVEDAETFYVMLGSPTNCVIDEPSICQVTITDANRGDTLADALDNVLLKWTTGGMPMWIPQGAVTSDGEDAAASGAMASNKVSYVQTAVTGTGTLSFAWSVTGKGVLRLYDGTKVLGAVTNDTAWEARTFSLTQNVTHTLKWSFTQGGDPSGRAYLDQVVWLPSGKTGVAVTVNADAPSGGTATGTGVYYTGAKVPLYAKPRPGWLFTGWTPTNLFVKPLAAAQTLTVGSNAVTVTANFAKVPLVTGLPRPPEGGTVTGSGICLPGKGVTLKAAAAGSWWFMNWSDGLRTATRSVSADGDVTLFAVFKLISTIAPPVISDPGPQTAMVGVPFLLPLQVDSDSLPMVTLTGLPTGLGYNASTKTIAGVPTAAVTNRTVTVTAKNVNVKAATQTFVITVDPLPVWAQGSFNGVAGTESLGAGSASMTVSALGAASGKLTLRGTNFSFSAKSYAARKGDGSFTLATTATVGKVAWPLTVSVNVPEITDATGTVPQTLSKADGALNGTGWTTLYRNVWKDAGMATVATNYTGYYTATLPGGSECGRGYLLFTVDKLGNVKTTGKLSDGTALSLAGSLILDETGRVFAVLYTSPTAYKGGCIFGLAEFFRSAAGAKVSVRLLDGEPLVWENLSPTATQAYGAGFSRELGLTGGWYDTVGNLYAYYTNKALSVGSDSSAPVPEIMVGTNRYSSVWWDPDGIVMAVVTNRSDVMTGVSAPKAGTPLKIGGSNVYDYASATNAVGLTITLTRATGVFKGSFKAWFDYAATHTPKLISYEGVLTPEREDPGDGVAGRGYFLWADKSQYLNPQGKPVPYSFNWSYDLKILLSDPEP